MFFFYIYLKAVAKIITKKDGGENEISLAKKQSKTTFSFHLV